MGLFLQSKSLLVVPTLHKKWSFPLRISSVDVTRSAGNFRFGHIYWRNPELKASFFCAVSRAGFEPVQNISLNYIELSYAAVITTT